MIHSTATKYDLKFYDFIKIENNEENYRHHILWSLKTGTLHV